jgi:hypothetical protein
MIFKDRHSASFLHLGAATVEGLYGQLAPIVNNRVPSDV